MAYLCFFLIASLLIASPSDASVSKNCDILGRELNAKVSAEPEACKGECAGTSDCRGWVFVSGWNRCFLKGIVKRKVSLVMHAAQIIQGSEGTRSVGPMARESDHKGKDLRRVSQVKTPEACGQVCLIEPLCRGIVFMEGYGDCWLKKEDGALRPKVFYCGQKP